MAPAGLYTFYRAIMTISNEVKLNPPSGLQSLFLSFSLFLALFSFLSPFATPFTSSLLCITGKEVKENDEEVKEEAREDDDEEKEERTT